MPSPIRLSRSRRPGPAIACGCEGPACSVRPWPGWVNASRNSAGPASRRPRRPSSTRRCRSRPGVSRRSHRAAPPRSSSSKTRCPTRPDKDKGPHLLNSSHPANPSLRPRRHRPSHRSRGATGGSDCRVETNAGVPRPSGEEVPRMVVTFGRRPSAESHRPARSSGDEMILPMSSLSMTCQIGFA